VKVKLTGFRELDRILSEEMPQATAKRILRKIAKDALEPMADRAAAMAPEDEGLLAFSVSVGEQRTRRVKKERERRSSIDMAMGPAGGTGALQYASFVEFGTNDTRPQPYMRPAWDGGKMAALEYVKDNLGTAVRQAAARHAKKAAR